MSSTCPNGHVSDSSDYCDVCGAPIDEAAQSAAPGASSASGAGPAAGASGSSPGGSSAGTSSGSASAPDVTTGAPATQECPSCGLVNTADALFCEGCGYDFTTGTMPRQGGSGGALDLGDGSGQPAAEQSPPKVAPPIAVEWVAEVWVDPDWYAVQESEEQCPSPGLPVVVPLGARSLLIGRTSKSRNIHPEIECASDTGVSRRQAQLTTDGQRWWVEDLQSSNGTYVGAASAPLPSDPLPPGQRRELATDDRIYVGAWTCIVVRRATPEEQGGS
jgi:hypothetical protein